MTRSLNLSYDRLFVDVTLSSNPKYRDLVSETGYRLFCRTLLGEEESLGTFTEAVIDAKRFLATERAFEELNDNSTLDKNVSFEEARSICNRIREFCAFRDKLSIPQAPHFVTGHAVVEDCYADIALNNDIIEIKYVDRNFRSTDLRQCLIYTVLNYLSGRPYRSNVVLFNPLRGIYSALSVSEIVDSAGGSSFIDFCHEFSYTVSSGDISL